MRPTVVSLSLQIASQIEAMAVMSHQILASAQKAVESVPDQEAYHAYTAYFYDVSQMMLYMEQFRVRTQGILEYSNTLPSLAVTMELVTTPRP